MENIELKNLKIRIAQRLLNLNVLSIGQMASIVELDESTIQELPNEVYDKAENEFQEKLQALCLGLNVEGLRTKIRSEEVNIMSQTADETSFFEAFQAAIYNILTDTNTPRSLIEHILETPEKLGLGEYPSKLSIYTAIQKLLKEEDSYIALVMPDNDLQPKHGEHSGTHWVFALHVPSFWKGIHWILVNRKAGKTYNYGA